MFFFTRVPTQSLESFCKDYLKTSRLLQMSDRQFQSLRIFLRGIKITVQYAGRPERTLKIRDLVRDVGNETFDKLLPTKKVQKMTVAVRGYGR